MFDSRSVCVVVTNKIEGERDYGEQALATPTLQRSHCLRGVVNMVLVCVKVQAAKRVFSMKDRTVVYKFTRTLFVHNQNKSDFVFHCFVLSRIAFHKSKRLASAEQ